MSVRTENSILIKAPLERIFETTSNLLLWPKLLPHYRWIRIVKTDDDGLIVKMAARRGWMPTSSARAGPTSNSSVISAAAAGTVKITGWK